MTKHDRNRYDTATTRGQMAADEKAGRRANEERLLDLVQMAAGFGDAHYKATPEQISSLTRVIAGYDNKKLMSQTAVFREIVDGKQASS